MTDLLRTCTLLAQENDAAPFMPFLPLIAIGVLFYFLLIRPQSRERARRKSVLDTLKKNDKVVTIGGIIGTIADLPADKTTVTLKVDDNTRIRIQRSSVQGLYGEETESG